MAEARKKTTPRKRAAAKKPAAARAAPTGPAGDATIMRFVVTGCARSGTKYTAHLLTRAGIACGHEDVFNRWDEQYGLPSGWRNDAFDGDASFIAAPFTEQLAADDLTVVHQVRPPLDVIRSICGMAWLQNLRLPYVAFVAQHTPAVTDEPPGPRRAAAYWLGWNELAAQHAAATWRLSDLTPQDVHALAERTGLDLDGERVAAALDRAPRNINHRGHRADVSIDDLGSLADAVADAADRYGVPLEAA